MRTWKILRDCRFKGDGVHEVVLGIARLHHLVLAGQRRSCREKIARSDLCTWLSHS
jgi:hypothetical protein